ncbi:hypothetical protein [Pseudopedobacter saltans]|nr:hypothetical protein [Pseudopedobacter saltans]
MKSNIITFILIMMFCGGISFAQTPAFSVIKLNPNDTTFVRVYNGVVVNKDFQIKGFNSIKTITDKNEANRLVLQKKPLMIIEDNKTDFEYQIENKLFTKNASLIKNLDYPLITRPIAINGKIVPKSALNDINFSEIKSVTYSKRKFVDGQDTPFGCIDISM